MAPKRTPEEIRQRQLEVSRECTRRYYLKNREREIARKLRHYYENKPRILARMKARRSTCPHCEREYCTSYLEAHIARRHANTESDPQSTTECPPCDE